MKLLDMVIRNMILLIVIIVSACSHEQKAVTITDTDGIFSETQSPASVKVHLEGSQLRAAREGRLGLAYRLQNASSILPGQLDDSDPNSPKIVLILPQGKSSSYEFDFSEQKTPFNNTVKASLDPVSGQIVFEESGKRILQYNYQTVYEKDVIHLPNAAAQRPSISSLGGVYLSEFLKENPNLRSDSNYTNLVYAIPRSDYVHPLIGLHGEMLTKDWPADGEFHHRGVFWAWPEVEVGSERGDIYALQRIFSRPTGKIEIKSGPVFAQVTAENLWKWGDTLPIVNEVVTIRTYRQTESVRAIDFNIQLTALKDSISLATRLTNSYGGFCVRMQTPEQQQILFITDTTNSVIRAWSDLSGIFGGSSSRSGLSILQHKDNPEYPGTWAHYENLSWVQPTFPTPNTRYNLEKGYPLILRYRLLIHSEENDIRSFAQKRWDAYNYSITPLFHFKPNVQ